MSKFDIEKALAGEKVINRDGDEVKIVFVSSGNDDFPVCGIVKINDDSHVANWYTKNGEFLDKNGTENLIMAPKTKKGFIAINKKQISSETCFRYATNFFVSKDDLLKSIKFHEWEIKDCNIIELEIEVE